MISNDLAVVQIHDRRKVQLLACHFELGDIRYPFLIWLIGTEVALQDVGCGFTHQPPIRLVLLGTHRAFQIQLGHQTAHLFTVNQLPFAAQRRRNSSIAVAAAVPMADVLD
ncbi:hypothetical protein D3C77_564110 [compost metagenome]